MCMKCRTFWKKDEYPSLIISEVTELGRGFIYIDNDNINESCLNNSKLHLNKKGTSLFSKNISTSVDVIWYASTDTKDIDSTNQTFKKKVIILIRC